MKKHHFFIVALVIIGCKKKPIEDNTLLLHPKIKPLPEIQVKENAIAFDSTLVLHLDNQLLLEFYRATAFKTVWQSITDRKLMLKSIRNSDQDGLFPDEYQIKQLEVFEKKYSSLTKNELIQYDLLLTLNTQQFLIHLRTGKLNPKKIYHNWDIEKPVFEVNSLLAEAFTNNCMETILESCQPNSAVYNQLKEALRLLQKYPDTPFSPILFDEKIMLNDTNPQIIAVKKRLNYWKDLKNADSLTAIYDKKTMAAIKRFQERHGLATDGVIGAGTIEALNFSKQSRKKQILVNLERWRWFATKPDEDYISINIPDYKLIVVENKDTTIIQKIVVGTSKRRTPILNSYLRTVVLNPTWTIPPTILKEDVVPAMIKNRNYLANKNISIYDSNNKLVSPQDWNPNKPHSYKYVQEPGPNNTLGEMKILFPNHHSIYLHDTNHKNVFGLHNRSLSSGCIRVEKPLELAGYFLNHSENWSKEKIDSIVATRKTHYIKIDKKYNLYLWYWTAWSQKGKLHFRKDIYEYDTDLYQKLVLPYARTTI